MDDQTTPPAFHHLRPLSSPVDPGPHLMRRNVSEGLSTQAQLPTNTDTTLSFSPMEGMYQGDPRMYPQMDPRMLQQMYRYPHPFLGTPRDSYGTGHLQMPGGNIDPFRNREGGFPGRLPMYHSPLNQAMYSNILRGFANPMSNASMATATEGHTHIPGGHGVSSANRGDIPQDNFRLGDELNLDILRRFAPPQTSNREMGERVASAVGDVFGGLHMPYQPNQEIGINVPKVSPVQHAMRLPIDATHLQNSPGNIHMSQRMDLSVLGTMRGPFDRSLSADVMNSGDHFLRNLQINQEIDSNMQQGNPLVTSDPTRHTVGEVDLQMAGRQDVDSSSGSDRTSPSALEKGNAMTQEIDPMALISNPQNILAIESRTNNPQEEFHLRQEPDQHLSKEDAEHTPGALNETIGTQENLLPGHETDPNITRESSAAVRQERALAESVAPLVTQGNLRENNESYQDNSDSGRNPEPIPCATTEMAGDDLMQRAGEEGIDSPDVGDDSQENIDSRIVMGKPHSSQDTDDRCADDHLQVGVSGESFDPGNPDDALQFNLEVKQEEESLDSTLGDHPMSPPSNEEGSRNQFLPHVDREQGVPSRNEHSHLQAEPQTYPATDSNEPGEHLRPELGATRETNDESLPEKTVEKGVCLTETDGNSQGNLGTSQQMDSNEVKRCSYPEEGAVSEMKGDESPEGTREENIGLTDPEVHVRVDLVIKQEIESGDSNDVPDTPSNGAEGLGPQQNDREVVPSINTDFNSGTTEAGGLDPQNDREGSIPSENTDFNSETTEVDGLDPEQNDTEGGVPSINTDFNSGTTEAGGLDPQNDREGSIPSENTDFNSETTEVDGLDPEQNDTEAGVPSGYTDFNSGTAEAGGLVMQQNDRGGFPSENADFKSETTEADDGLDAQDNDTEGSVPSGNTDLNSGTTEAVTQEKDTNVSESQTPLSTSSTRTESNEPHHQENDDPCPSSLTQEADSQSSLAAVDEETNHKRNKTDPNLDTSADATKDDDDDSIFVIAVPPGSDDGSPAATEPQEPNIEPKNLPSRPESEVTCRPRNLRPKPSTVLPKPDVPKLAKPNREESKEVPLGELMKDSDEEEAPTGKKCLYATYHVTIPSATGQKTITIHNAPVWIENNIMTVPDFTLGSHQPGLESTTKKDTTSTNEGDAKEGSPQKDADASLRTLPAIFKIFLPGDQKGLTFQAPVGVRDGNLIFGSQALAPPAMGGSQSSPGSTVIQGAITGPLSPGQNKKLPIPRLRPVISNGPPGNLGFPKALGPLVSMGRPLAPIRPNILPSPDAPQPSRKRKRGEKEKLAVKRPLSPLVATRDFEPWKKEGSIFYYTDQFNVNGSRAGGSAESGLNRRKVSKLYTLLNHRNLGQVALFCGRGKARAVAASPESPRSAPFVPQAPRKWHSLTTEEEEEPPPIPAEEEPPEEKTPRRPGRPRKANKVRTPKKPNTRRYQVYSLESHKPTAMEEVSGSMGNALRPDGGVVLKTKDGFTIIKDPNKRGVRKGIPWIEMLKVFCCRMCVESFTSLLVTCAHLVGEHGEYTTMLTDHLSSVKAQETETNETLLDLVSRKRRSLQAETAAASAETEPIGFTGGLVEFEGEATRYVVEKYGALYGFDRMEGAFSSQNMIEQMFRDVDKANEVDRKKETARFTALNERIPEVKEVVPRENVKASKEATTPSEQGTDQALPTSERPGIRDASPPKQFKLSEEEQRHEQILLEAGRGLIPVMQPFVTIATKCPKCQLNVTMMRFAALHSCVRTEKHALCEICGHVTSFVSLRQHYAQCHSKANQGTSKCKFCNKDISTKGMRSHVQRVHSDSGKATCVVCKVTLASKHHLRRHEAIHRKVMPYKCLQCHRSFNQRTNLKTHMRQHTGERPYVCEHCQKSFTHNVSLKTHLKRYHGIDLWNEGQTGGGRPKHKKPPAAK